MKIYNYKIVVEECEEGGFYAECPAFPGCHVEGETFEETMQEMKHALRVFIDDFIERKEVLPSDKFIVASIQVTI